MNYSESQLILEEIKKAKHILLNCHKRPDPDSVGSTLALYEVLIAMGKSVNVVCPDNLPENVLFLDNSDKVRKIDYSDFNYSNFDLFITLDSSSWSMVTGRDDINVSSKIPVIVIDHHKTNSKFGIINLVDPNLTSCGELLYLVLKDWEIKITSAVATDLLTGIIADTGVFRFPGTGKRTLVNSSDLIEFGANKEKIVLEVYSSSSLELLKFWSEVLKVMKVDKLGKFAWAAIPYKRFRDLGSPIGGKETAATLFAQIVKNTDFGFVAVEEKEKQLLISFRSRTGFDTSKLAIALGGGGHIYSSGGSIKGLPFNEAVKKVLETARKYANKNIKRN